MLAGAGRLSCLLVVGAYGLRRYLSLRFRSKEDSATTKEQDNVAMQQW